MSYARKQGGCEVYVYDDVGYGLVCSMCDLIEHPMGFGIFIAESDPLKMLTHLQEHRAKGHDTGDAIEQLDAEVAAGDWSAERRAEHEAAWKSVQAETIARNPR